MEKILAMAFDKDGSVTPQNKPFSRKVTNFFWALNEAGLKMGPSTGKGAELNRGIGFALGFNFPFIIGENGGIVYIWDGGSYRKEKLAGGEDQIKRFAEIIKYDKFGEEFILRETRTSFFDEAKETMLSMFPASDSSVDSSIKWEVFFNEIINTHRLQLKVIRHSDGCADVQSSEVSKALGIQCICREFKLEPENILTVVDGKNDMEMTQGGVLPIAPANAIPEIKKSVKNAGGYIAKAEDGEGFIEGMKHLAKKGHFKKRVTKAILS